MSPRLITVGFAALCVATAVAAVTGHPAEAFTAAGTAVIMFGARPLAGARRAASAGQA